MSAKETLSQRRYFIEFKMEMFRLTLEEKVSVAALVQQHDVNDNLLFKWIRRWQREGRACHPQTHLAEFSGELQADAYAGFNELYHNAR